MTTNLIEVMEQKPEYNWMDEARQIAAQAWCDPENSHKEIDAALCESLARRIAAWMQTGAQHAKNEAFWKKKFDELTAALRVAKEALGYHTQQTRPIDKTTEAITAITEVLENGK